MYLFPFSAVVILASFILSHARHTFSTSKNEINSNLSGSIETSVCMTPACVIAAADVLTSLDENEDPCDDFYRFACGGWLKRHELQEDQSRINVDLEMQNDLNRKLKELLEIKYKSSEPHFVKMLKDFYATCMGTEKDGSEPLKKILSRLGGWPVIEGDKWDESTFDWVDSLISLRQLGYDYNILMKLDLLAERSKLKIYLEPPSLRFIDGSNLTLGLDDPQIASYFRLMVNAAKLLGADETAAEKEMLDVVNFTISLENCMFSKKGYKGKKFLNAVRHYYLKVKQLQKEIPQIPWLKYFNGLLNNDTNENGTVELYNPSFFFELADLMTSTEKRIIANYIMMRVVLESSEFLSEDWNRIYEMRMKLSPDDDEDDDEDKRKEKSRWKRCLSSAEKEMGIAFSSFYVTCCFKKESKDEAMIILKYIHKEFLKILEDSDWMDDKTREKAEEKANAMKVFMGYPDELLNDTIIMKAYENLSITTDSYLENIMALHKMAKDEELSKNGNIFNLKIHESPEFNLAAKVNAFYNPFANSIIIPAAILGDAFYEKDRPNYLNFGAIGYVIGHEITHGFDNEGRHYDKDGDRKSWWDKESDEHFRKKVQCMIEQYDNYTTDIGLKVNGEKTQDENIADNGGLKEAYLAYISWTKDNGIESTLPGLNYTQNQLFWISAAYTYCANYQPEKLKMMLLLDEHSPGRFRVIGPMSNLEEFSRDFKCSADSPMNRKYKCRVW